MKRAAHGDMSRPMGRGIEIFRSILTGEFPYTIPLCGMSSVFFKIQKFFYSVKPGQRPGPFLAQSAPANQEHLRSDRFRFRVTGDVSLQKKFRRPPPADNSRLGRRAATGQHGLTKFKSDQHLYDTFFWRVKEFAVLKKVRKMQCRFGLSAQF